MKINSMFQAVAAAVIGAGVIGITSQTGCAVATTGACETTADCAPGAECVDGLCEGGAKPTAAFDMPATSNLNDEIILDASASKKADGTSAGLEYVWRVTAPSGVNVEKIDGGVKGKIKTGRAHAKYKVELVVKDRGTPSDVAAKELEVANSPPVAKIKFAPAVWGRGMNVQLDATESADADNDSLTYTFAVTKEPADPPANKPVPNRDIPSKAVFQTGQTSALYTVKVTVDDGKGGTSSAELTQGINNVPPVVSALPDAAIDHSCAVVGDAKVCTATFHLVASASDPDASLDPTKTKWTLESKPSGAVAEATFTPVSGKHLESDLKISTPSDKAFVGEYVVKVEVADSDGATATKTAKITVGNKDPTLTPAATGATVTGIHTFNSDTNQFEFGYDNVVTAGDADGDDVKVEFLALEKLDANLAGVTIFDPEILSGEGAPVPPKFRALIGASATKPNPGSVIDPTDAAKPLYKAKTRITDAQGGTFLVEQNVVITNNVPTVAGIADAVSPGHTYQTTQGTSQYPPPPFSFAEFDVANVAAVDVDDDPLTFKWVGLDASVADVKLVSTTPSLILATTSQSKVNVPLAVNIEVSDPFGKKTYVKKFTLGNRPPTVGSFTASGACSAPVLIAGTCPATACPIACRTGTARGVFSGTSTTTAANFNAAYPSNLVASQITDPDNDPVTTAKVVLTGCPTCTNPAGSYNTLLDSVGNPASGTLSCSNGTCSSSAYRIGGKTCYGTSLQFRTYGEVNTLEVTVTDSVGASAKATTSAVFSSAACLPPI